MLFAVKNHFVATLLAALALAGAATLLGARVRWEDARDPWTWGRAGAGLAVIVASDGLLHGLFLLVFGAPYRERFHALAAYFRPQGAREIAAGALLAGAGEEALFRGALLPLLAGPLGTAGAVAATAALFGVAHLIPDRRLAPFAIWAVWEGALLGGVYLASGSLLAVAIAHAAHDAGGFAAFRLLRARA